MAPPECDLVFDKTTEDMSKELIKSDAYDYMVQNNFVIKPGGKIWNRLCQRYHFLRDQTISAASVYQESQNSTCTWQEHYSFTCYRQDDFWAGPPLRRFEIQPILDVSRLPEHHYLNYHQAKSLR